jgi:hypothetical protein
MDRRAYFCSRQFRLGGLCAQDLSDLQRQERHLVQAFAGEAGEGIGDRARRDNGARPGRGSPQLASSAAAHRVDVNPHVDRNVLHQPRWQGFSRRHEITTRC